MGTTHQGDDSDSNLLAGAAAGDHAAFEQLYRLYERRVFHYVCTLVQDRAVAEEIVIDAMTAVWLRASTFSHTSRLSTWIFGIARHKAMDALRQMVRHHRDTALEEAVKMPVCQESAVETLQREDMAALTQQALKQLSTEHQEVLRLVFYEELSYDEIAGLLSIPVNTVKTRVFYAKQRLKQQLEALGQPEQL
jgi:RNA polymerase sigma-70 factor (ECF subfamily)